MKFKHLYTKFQTIFDRSDSLRLFFAPGRINLIGEHTDYNGGYVFPAAISLGTYALGIKRSDKLIRLYSMNIPESGIITCHLEELSYKSKDGWSNFPKGIIKYMKESNYPINSGMDILFYGDIPNSAGLSSSASLEMATSVMLKGMFNFDISNIDMIKIGQKVENEYIGVNSGIMDQYAIVMGKKDNALHLNTESLTSTYAPIQLDHHSIVIIHTNKNRHLADSKYNERRKECEEAVKSLQTVCNINNLGELTPYMFNVYKYVINDPIIRKRAKHIVFENHRTKQAVSKLISNDLIGFGELMNQSHLSLKTYYEVTGIELDTIVEAAWQQEGVLGARMTGAGFGGCAIAIVHHQYIDIFKCNISKIYQEEIGYAPSFYIPDIVDGANEIIKEVI